MSFSVCTLVLVLCCSALAAFEEPQPVPQPEAAEASLDNTWSSCGKPGSHYQVTSVQATVPHKGQPFTMTVEGVLDETVTSGSIHSVTYWNGIKILETTLDLCSTMKDQDPCPWQKGPFVFKQTQTLPSNAPSGKYKETFTVTDQGIQEVMCIQGEFPL